MTEYSVPRELDSVQRAVLGAGAVGVLGLVIGFAIDPEQFYRSYLLGFLYWLAIAMGCLALMMIHHLSGGAWGLMIRRPLEAAAKTIPILGVLFIPVLIGMPAIYEWARSDAAATDAVIRHKAPYLNPTFFTIRAVLYFAIWSGLALILSTWSAAQDREPPTPGADRKFRLVSGPGVLIYGLTITFASIDWVMSIDARWYSTIFGLMFMVGQGLSALAFIVAVMFFLTRYKPMADVVTPKNIHDLGKLTLAFVMLWAYLGYSQFLIIWSANLPEEIPWYLRRFDNGWQWVSVLLVVGHFALPFCLLLSRDLKRVANRLVKVAALILLIRAVDLYWLTAPQFHPESLLPHWLDVAAVVGLGGIWVTLFMRNLKGRALIPVNDPYLREALADGH